MSSSASPRSTRRGAPEPRDAATRSPPWYLRRRLSREALRWSRLRRSRLRLRRLRSRLRERLWLRFRCRFSLSRSGQGGGEDELRDAVAQPTRALLALPQPQGGHPQGEGA